MKESDESAAKKPPQAATANRNAKKGRPATGASVRAGSAKGAAPQSSARSGFSSQTTNKTGGVVKTIVLPHEDINRLSSEA